MDFTYAARQKKRPNEESKNGPDKRECQERPSYEEHSNGYPDLEAYIPKAGHCWHRQHYEEKQQEEGDEDHGHQDSRKAHYLANQHQSAVAPCAKLILKLHASIRVCWVVMPTNVVQHLATDPTPMCFAFACHVIASRHLFSGKTTCRTWLCAIDPGIEHLLLHHLPLVLQAGLSTTRVSIAVIVTEVCSTVCTAHFCNNAAILIGVRSAQPTALRAGSELGVGLHLPKSI